MHLQDCSIFGGNGAGCILLKTLSFLWNSCSTLSLSSPPSQAQPSLPTPWFQTGSPSLPSHILPAPHIHTTNHPITLLSFRIVPFSEKYSKIMYAVQEASEYGKQSDAVCAEKYSW